MSPSEFIKVWADVYLSSKADDLHITGLVSEELGWSVAKVHQKAKMLVKAGVILPGYNVDSDYTPPVNYIDFDPDDDNNEEDDTNVVFN